MLARSAVGAAWQFAQIHSEATSRSLSSAPAARRRVSVPGPPHLSTQWFAETALHVRGGSGGGGDLDIGWWCIYVLKPQPKHLADSPNPPHTGRRCQHCVHHTAGATCNS